MSRQHLLLLLLFLFISAKSFAQADAYSGTWRMEYQPGQGIAPVNMELQVAESERGLLYSAHLILQCDGFTGEYDLLLVKKNTRELAISRNKYPVTENLFGLGSGLFFLNGLFDHSKDLQGIPTLSVNRLVSKQNSNPVYDTANLTAVNKKIAVQLVNFLKDVDIQLKKINSKPWRGQDNNFILSPGVSPAYFGLQDTISLPTRDGIFNLAGNKKSGTDIVSFSVNGRIIIEQLELGKKKHTEDILLDTGLNIITFFADNFGSALPSKGKLSFEFAGKPIPLDFASKRDSAATFIVAKFYCGPDKNKETYFQNKAPAAGDKPLQKNEKLITNLIATSQEITLAIWDDATEDGDSISINIDGKWIVQGFPVRKNPQFLKVSLKPGPNTITFIADNLGSIPPNTSVLEIIDGKKRKSFTIETILGEANLVKIFYDTKAGL